MLNINSLESHNEIVNKLNGFNYMAKNISNESSPMFLTNISKFFIDKFSVISNVLGFNQNKCNKLGTKEYNVFVRDLRNMHGRLLKFIKDNDYRKVADLRIPTVVGMKYNIVKTATELQKAFSMLNGAVSDGLDRVDTYVAMVMSDKDFRIISKQQEEDKEVIKLEKELSDILVNLIDTKKVDDSDKFENVFPSINSLSNAYDLLLSIGNGLTLENMNKINEKIDGIVEKISVMQEEMARKNYEVSKTVIKKLSTDLENNAKLVTVSTSLLHLYNQCVMCLTRVVEQ